MIKSRYSLNQPDEEQDFFYYKSSMIPTFEPGDVLKVRPPGGQPVKAGDIIVFFCAEKQKTVTHRVVVIRNGGIITCGDTPSNRRDPWILSRKEIVGTVTGYERSGRYFTVSNGRMGLIRFYYLRLKAVFIKGLRFLLRPFYRFSAENITLKFLLPEACRPRILNFKRKNNGREYIIVMGKKVIGWKRSFSNNWEIKFPYRLFMRDL